MSADLLLVLPVLVPLAGLMGRATESLAVTLGTGLGGLLNATFGNAAELIIALFALSKGPQMYPLVKEWLEGSGSQAEVRDRHSLSKSVFSYWLKKYRSGDGGQGPVGGFAALTVRPAAVHAAGVEVVFPNGVVVRVGAGTGPAFIQELAGLC